MGPPAGTLTQKRPWGPWPKRKEAMRFRPAGVLSLLTRCTFSTELSTLFLGPTLSHGDGSVQACIRRVSGV